MLPFLLHSSHYRTQILSSRFPTHIPSSLLPNPRLVRSASTQPEGEPGSASSGYIHFDQEEKVEEEVRQLHPFKSVFLKRSYISRAQDIRFGQQYIAYKHQRHSQLAGSLGEASRKKVRERIQDIAKSGRDAKRSGQRSENAPVFVPSPFHGNMLSTQDFNTRSAQLFGILQPAHEADPDVDFDMVLAKSGRDLPVSPEKQDFHLLQPQMHDHLLNPSHLLKAQAKMSLKDQQRNHQPDLDLVAYQTAQHNVAKQVISEVEALLRRNNFSSKLPARMPSLAATQTFTAVTFESQYLPVEDNNHIRLMTDKYENEERAEERRQMMAQRDPTHDDENEVLDDESHEEKHRAMMNREQEEMLSRTAYDDDNADDDESTDDDTDSDAGSDGDGRNSDDDNDADGAALDSKRQLRREGEGQELRDQGDDQEQDDDADPGRRADAEQDEQDGNADYDSGSDDEITYAQSPLHAVDDILAEKMGNSADLNHRLLSSAILADRLSAPETPILLGEAQLLTRELRDLRRLAKLRVGGGKPCHAQIERAIAAKLQQQPDQKQLRRALALLKKPQPNYPEVLAAAEASLRSELHSHYLRLLRRTSEQDFDALLKRVGGLQQFPGAAREALVGYRRQLSAKAQLRHLDPAKQPLEVLLLTMERDGAHFQDHALLDKVLDLADSPNPPFVMHADTRSCLELQSRLLHARQAAENVSDTSIASLVEEIVSAPKHALHDPTLALHNLAEQNLELSQQAFVGALDALVSFDARILDKSDKSSYHPETEELEPAQDDEETDAEDAATVEWLMDYDFESNEGPDYRSSDDDVINNPEELMAEVAADNLSTPPSVLDRYLSEQLRSQKRSHPLVVERTFLRPYRKRLAEFLHFGFQNLIADTSSLFQDESSTKSYGIIYDICRAYKRSPEEFQIELQAIITEDSIPESVHALSEPLFDLFTRPASIGIQRSSGETFAEARERHNLRHGQVAKLKAQLAASPFSLERDVLRVLEYMESLHATFESPADKRLLECLILMHLQMYQTSAHPADLVVDPSTDSVETSSHYVSSDLDSWQESWLYPWLNWIEEHRVATFPMPDDPVSQFKRPSQHRSGVSVATVEYCQPIASELQEKAVKFSERKVSFMLDLSKLHLPAPVLDRLHQLAQTRYNPATQTLRIVADAYPDAPTNRRYAKQLIRELMTEAFKAHPKFVPFSDAVPTNRPVFSAPPETPHGRLLSSEYYDQSLLSLTPSDVDSIRDVEHRWNLKQQLHQYVLFTPVPADFLSTSRV